MVSSGRRALLAFCICFCILSMVQDAQADRTQLNKLRQLRNDFLEWAKFIYFPSLRTVTRNSGQPGPTNTHDQYVWNDRYKSILNDQKTKTLLSDIGTALATDYGSVKTALDNLMKDDFASAETAGKRDSSPQQQVLRGNVASDVIDSLYKLIKAERKTVGDTLNILVVGGGPVGIISAASLAREGHNVTLVEKRSMAMDAEEVVRNQTTVFYRDQVIRMDKLVSTNFLMLFNSAWHNWYNASLPVDSTDGSYTAESDSPLTTGITVPVVRYDPSSSSNLPGYGPGPENKRGQAVKGASPNFSAETIVQAVRINAIQLELYKWALANIDSSSFHVHDCFQFNGLEKDAADNMYTAVMQPSTRTAGKYESGPGCARYRGMSKEGVKAATIKQKFDLIVGADGTVSAVRQLLEKVHNGPEVESHSFTFGAPESLMKPQNNHHRAYASLLFYDEADSLRHENSIGAPQGNAKLKKDRFYSIQENTIDTITGMMDGEAQACDKYPEARPAGQGALTTSISALGTIECYKLNEGNTKPGPDDFFKTEYIPRVTGGASVYRGFHNYAYEPLQRKTAIHYMGVGLNDTHVTSNDDLKALFESNYISDSTARARSIEAMRASVNPTLKNMFPVQFEELHDREANDQFKYSWFSPLTIQMQYSEHTEKAIKSPSSDSINQVIMLEGDSGHSANFLRASGLNTGLRGLFSNNPAWMSYPADGFLKDGDFESYLVRYSLMDVANALGAHKNGAGVSKSEFEKILKRKEEASVAYSRGAHRLGAICIDYIRSGGEVGWCIPTHYFDDEDDYLGWLSALALKADISDERQAAVCRSLIYLYFTLDIRVQEFLDTAMNNYVTKAVIECTEKANTTDIMMNQPGDLYKYHGINFGVHTVLRPPSDKDQIKIFKHIALTRYIGFKVLEASRKMDRFSLRFPGAAVGAANTAQLFFQAYDWTRGSRGTGLHKYYKTNFEPAVFNLIHSMVYAQDAMPDSTFLINALVRAYTALADFRFFCCSKATVQGWLTITEQPTDAYTKNREFLDVNKVDEAIAADCKYTCIANCPGEAAESRVCALSKSKKQAVRTLMIEMAKHFPEDGKCSDKAYACPSDSSPTPDLSESLPTAPEEINASVSPARGSLGDYLAGFQKLSKTVQTISNMIPEMTQQLKRLRLRGQVGQASGAIQWPLSLQPHDPTQTSLDEESMPADEKYSDAAAYKKS